MFGAQLITDYAGILVVAYTIFQMENFRSKNLWAVTEINGLSFERISADANPYMLHGQRS